MGFCAPFELRTYEKQRTYGVSDVNCVSHARITGTRWTHLLAAIICLFFAGAAPAQEQPHAQAPSNVFRVPFHTVNGMILIDARVNGQPSVMLFDTGARTTLLSNVSAPTLQLSKPTYIGESARADLCLGSLTIASMFVVVNLEQAKKQVGAHFDGILGQDILREFSSVRINYRASVVEFEK